MIRAWQASRRACSAVIRSPVVVSATPRSLRSVSRSRVTITLVAVPPCVGQAGVGEVLEECAERLAAAAGDGELVDLAQGVSRAAGVVR